MNLANMTLKTKLIAGFSTVLVLLAIVSVVGYKALNDASNGFTQYREMARDANLAGRLQANMLMVRMNVKDFIITGSEKDHDQYLDYLEKMDGFLETAHKEINNPERAQKIDNVDVAHTQYHDAFEHVYELKSQRNNHLDNLANVSGPLMGNALTQIMDSAETDGDMSAAYNSGLAMKHMLLGRLYVMKFLDTNSEKDAELVRSAFKEMSEYLKILDDELQNPTRLELLGTVKSNKLRYVESFDKLAGAIFERNTIIRDTLDKIGPEIAKDVEDVKLSIKDVQDAIGPKLQASNQRAVSTIMIISAFALLAGAGLVYFTTRSVANQLGGDPSEIADVARNISQGNLAINFKKSKNGGSLGVYRDMETMTGNLRNMFMDINSGVETLSSSATELSAVSEQMSQGVQDVSGKSNTVNAASEETSSNMNSMAAAMEQLAANANMVSTSSEEMSSTIGEIAQNAEKARGVSDEAALKASSASTNMEKLRTAANSIGKVVETITDISEQVNLLALNATIEAARAGDAGKGFAVVANEIKDLAKMTAEATQDIKDKIQGIQGTTSTTVEQINEINQVISEVNGVVANIATAVEQQSAATKEIASNVAQASEGIREVSENVNQSSTVSGEISRDIADVNASMGEMSSSSSQVNMSALELSKLSENLKETVSQFRT